MDFFSAILLGSALAMDAAAVSAVCGMDQKQNFFPSALITAFTFALFQTAMPILGWSVGKLGNNFISQFENIFAFAVLLFLGINNKHMVQLIECVIFHILIVYNLYNRNYN